MQQEYIKHLLENNCNIQYRDLVISDLRDSYKKRVSNGYNYQVHCENKLFRFSHLYNDIDIAIDKFIAIKNKMKEDYESKD